MNGASCGADGLSLDGSNDWADIDDFEIGGTSSIEVYVKYVSFNNKSPVFDFSNGDNSDNVILYNDGTAPSIKWAVLQGSTWKAMDMSNFDSATWRHVVVTVSDTNIKVYKNGVLVGTNTDGNEPNVQIRTQHWLGRSAWDDRGYFDGTIAYVKIWHGVKLQLSDVETVYAGRDTTPCPSNTLPGSNCASCEADKYGSSFKGEPTCAMRTAGR
ncbi:hypothetical protein TL16_g02934 [Triparma laevis f. inornata]|uniref:LamG-like jellyroll fold domain-containing protein n=1 Tax=Triparma laevis f. inornata TaxID=1714386 RepID=A0A9W7A234_9STRA|nr:hypothetical protein TL16_g02934 [Triparma laevis f. inornata]